MFRYLALIHDPLSEMQRRVAENVQRCVASDSVEWQCIFGSGRLRVWCTGLRNSAICTYRMADDAGVVLGNVFCRGTPNGEPHASAAFGVRETADVVNTDGRVLVERYWGRYVAFLKAKDGSGVVVLRSPTGEIDCLCASLSGARIYFSGTEGCPVTGLLDHAIDWSFVAADLSMILPDTRTTGLRAVKRLLRGECEVVKKGGNERRTYWDPCTFVSTHVEEDVATAASILRKTAMSCVAAWGASYQSVITFLSGGLDSSIVTCLLHQASQSTRVACLNYRNQFDAVTDERRYARLVAEATGYELIEHEQVSEFSIEPILCMPNRVSPFCGVFEISHAPLERDVARARNAGAYFLGMGGDQLFFQNGANHMCIDYVWRNGFRRQLFHVALNAARMTGETVWSTAWSAVRHRGSDPLDVLLREEWFSPLLNAEATKAVMDGKLFISRWLRHGDVPPGKFWQIMGLALPEHLNSPCALEGDPEYVSPLLSQPLQELCLALPTYVLTANGQDRGLARAAFARDLPREIVLRRAKGIVDDYLKNLVAANLKFLKDFLLDGELATTGILNRKRLERELLTDVAKNVGFSSHILRCASSEAWLQGWKSASKRIAA